MGAGLAFAISAACMVAGFVIGIRFRVGKHRAFVAVYRNWSLPAVYRNLPLVAPVIAVATVPLLIFGGLISSGISVPIHLERRVVGFLLFLVWTALFGGVGLAAVLAFVSPRCLVPKWLRDEDGAVGFTPPAWDRFDWATLAFGVLALVAAVVTLVVALIQLVG